MLHFMPHPRFHFKEHLKMDKNVKKKMYLILQLMVHLTVYSMGTWSYTWLST